MSVKRTRPTLKPVVFTFEMLLPMTSIQVWWARNPEIAENMDRIMVPTPLRSQSQLHTG
ncbi:hypothetical protein HRbin26_00743 [bacterium HR26]|nr:hypothetical protein HRbin26_00743 [bacterium HR26]